MDTQINKLINLDSLEETEREKIKNEWALWQAGLLKKRPRFVPAKGDRLPLEPTRPKKVKRSRHPSYRDFCR